MPSNIIVQKEYYGEGECLQLLKTEEKKDRDLYTPIYATART